MNQEELLEIIADAKAGDPSAQEQLVMEVQNKVYYHCKKYLKNEEDAQDAAQDVLISMLTNLDKLREPAAFWGWLNRITANRCKQLLIRGPQEWQIPEDEDGNSMLDSLETLDEQTIPDHVLDTDETRRLVMEIIDDLPAEQRMTVVFFYYDEMSVKDIAEAMEVSEGTVKSRLNYARKAIKQEVEKLEKKGTKLYSVSILPFLAYFLRMGAESEALSPAAASELTKGTLAAAGNAGAAAGAATGAAGATAAAGTSAASTTAAVGAKAAGALSMKLIAGIVAGVVIIGGIGAAVVHFSNSAEKPPAVPVAVVEPNVTDEPAEPTPEPTVEPEEPSRPYEEAYIATVLEQSQRRKEDARYGLVYVDGDTTPELVVSYDDSVINLYTIGSDGSLVTAVDEWNGGRLGYPQYYPGQNSVLKQYSMIMGGDHQELANICYRINEDYQLLEYFQDSGAWYDEGDPRNHAPGLPDELAGLECGTLCGDMTAEEILALLGYGAGRAEPAETLDFDFSDYAGSYTPDPRLAVSHSGTLLDLTLNSDGTLSGGGEIPSWSSTPMGAPTDAAPIELRVGSSGYGGDGTYTFILQSRRIETGAGIITAEEYYVLCPAGTADPTGGDSSTVRLYYVNVDGGAWNMLYTKN